jgi:hypothetical protein
VIAIVRTRILIVSIADQYTATLYFDGLVINTMKLIWSFVI